MKSGLRTSDEFNNDLGLQLMDSAFWFVNDTKNISALELLEIRIKERKHELGQNQSTNS